MTMEKVELLEDRLKKIITLVAELKEKNLQLENQLEGAHLELKNKGEEIHELRKRTEALTAASRDSESLRVEREEIRSKIESMLDNLEKIDII